MSVMLTASQGDSLRDSIAIFIPVHVRCVLWLHHIAILTAIFCFFDIYCNRKKTLFGNKYSFKND